MWRNVNAWIFRNSTRLPENRQESIYSSLTENTPLFLYSHRNPVVKSGRHELRKKGKKGLFKNLKKEIHFHLRVGRGLAATNSPRCYLAAIILSQSRDLAVAEISGFLG